MGTGKTKKMTGSGQQDIPEVTLCVHCKSLNLSAEIFDADERDIASEGQGYTRITEGNIEFRCLGCDSWYKVAASRLAVTVPAEVSCWCGADYNLNNPRDEQHVMLTDEQPVPMLHCAACGRVTAIRPAGLNLPYLLFRGSYLYFRCKLWVRALLQR